MKEPEGLVQDLSRGQRKASSEHVLVEDGTNRDGLQGNGVRVLNKLAEDLTQKGPEFYIP